MARLTPEFWEKFFHTPLQLELRKNGHSIERLVLYCLIHHDHHFVCGWAFKGSKRTTKFFPESAVIEYDEIRTIVEEDFNDLYKFIKRPYILSNFKGKIIGIARFLGDSGAHDWSLKLAGMYVSDLH